MKLIVGLGNPSPQYNFTRHNFGFLALDFYAKTHNLTFQPSAKFLSHITNDNDVVFAKPQTFYNAVGQSISKLVNFYKIDPTIDLLVICDDFDLPFGDLRFRAQGSDAGNNGLKSTISHLKTSAFPRLRLGTDDSERRKILGDTDFVLSKFTPEEREQLPELLAQISTKIDHFIA